MSSSDYHFVTHWRVLGTVEEVSGVLADPEDLPRWWPSVYREAQTLEPGDDRGVGRRVRLLTKGFLPYTLSWQLRVVESRRPHGYTIEATGDFVGRGVWTFEQEGAWVDITFDWSVAVGKPGIKELSPLLKPVFAANHRWAMRRGEESLREELSRRRGASRRPLSKAPPPAALRPWVFLAAAVASLLAIFLVAAWTRRAAGRRRRGLRFTTGRDAEETARPGPRRSRPRRSS